VRHGVSPDVPALSGAFLRQKGLEVPHMEEDAPPDADTQ
jgi:hypothetical protein